MWPVFYAAISLVTMVVSAVRDVDVSKRRNITLCPFHISLRLQVERNEISMTHNFKKTYFFQLHGKAITNNIIIISVAGRYRGPTFLTSPFTSLCNAMPWTPQPSNLGETIAPLVIALVFNKYLSSITSMV